MAIKLIKYSILIQPTYIVVVIIVRIMKYL